MHWRSIWCSFPFDYSLHPIACSIFYSIVCSISCLIAYSSAWAATLNPRILAKKERSREEAKKLIVSMTPENSPHIRCHQRSNWSDTLPPWQFGQYTPLNVLRTHILCKSRGNCLRLGRCIQSQKGITRTSTFYHLDHDHDMEKCIHLWDEIEKHIHHGQLDQFLWDRRKRRDALAFSPALAKTTTEGRRASQSSY